MVKNGTERHRDVDTVRIVARLARTSRENMMTGDESRGGTVRFDRRGITHCYPHDNKMPCADCARELIQSVEPDSDHE